MRNTRLIMGMPITIDIVGDVSGSVSASAFQYFRRRRCAVQPI